MTEILDDVDSEVIEDRFANAEKALENTGKNLPTISPADPQDPRKKRRNSSVSMPDYVWDLLRDEGYISREPQNVVIMRGLKAIGLLIDEEDLIDPRKVRYQG